MLDVAPLDPPASSSGGARSGREGALSLPHACVAAPVVAAVASPTAAVSGVASVAASVEVAADFFAVDFVVASLAGARRGVLNASRIGASASSKMGLVFALPWSCT